MDPLIFDRKLEHIEIVLNRDVTHRDNCRETYDGITLIHRAFPGINFDDVDTTALFLGYTLSAPLIITGMTGGHRDLIPINEKLAKLAEKYRIAIGVGSQRPLLINRDNNEVLESYRIVRKTAVNVPVIGNIGINTIQDYSIDDIIEIVDLIKADALAIHLNPGQEVVQPEGDTRFNHNLLDRVNELLDKIHVPVLVKEVGNGLSMEVVKEFYSRGIRIFDVAGACGTNWILVEKYRSRDSDKRLIADRLSSWGIPTPLSVIETRYIAPDSTIIASGGVWDGLKAVKNIVLGADLAGFARPVLVNLSKGIEQADRYIRNYIMEMKTIMFLIGADNIEELKDKPIVLSDTIINYMEQRGIDRKVYDEVRRNRRRRNR